MVVSLLTPGDIDCEFESDCNKRSYGYCTKCSNNKIAVLTTNKEKNKKNFFKRLK